MNKLLSALLALGMCSIGLPLFAQTHYSDLPEAEKMAGFGGAIEIANDQILIGEAPLQDPDANAFKNGTIYVFDKNAENEWTEIGQINAQDGHEGNNFGRAMSLSDNWLLVGATGQNDGQGAGYLFERDAAGAWNQVAKLQSSEIQTAEYLGRSTAISAGQALVASVGFNEARGGVFVFAPDADGNWTESGKLMASDAASGDYFGWGLSAYENRVLITAPSLNGGNGGRAFIFEYDEAAGTWNEVAKLEATGVEDSHQFGYSALLVGDYAMIGAPGGNDNIGLVYVFMRNEEGVWEEYSKLNPFDPSSRSSFGFSMDMNQDQIWVGSPLSDGFMGSVYQFNLNEDGNDIASVEKIKAPGNARGTFFGGNLAVTDNLAAIAVLGADGGLGTTKIFTREDMDSDWVEENTVFTMDDGMEAITGSQINCEGGEAGDFGCEGVDLISFVPVQQLTSERGIQVNDVWGWTDEQSGKEYVIVGRTNGTSFVDISDPFNPIYIGDLPKTETSPTSTWRDMKVYKDHAFIVADGAAEHGMQVFDLGRLRDVSLADMPVVFDNDAHYTEIASAHNIVINEETGFAYTVGNSSGGETCGGGLHIVNIQDPKNPTFAGCFADPTTGRASTGYTHDAQCVVYDGPDTEHQGKEICFSANETALSIGDVSDKSNTIALSRATYPNVGYSHQGWLTEDHKYFYMNDELDETGGKVENTRTLIWDVQDLDDPQLIKEFFLDSQASDHNLYIRGNLMYQSNYKSGLRILDITDIENPVEVGHFDTTPMGENTAGFSGSWSNYPYFPSGVIAVTSMGEGLFLVKKRDIDI